MFSINAHEQILLHQQRLHAATPPPPQSPLNFMRQHAAFNGSGTVASSSASANNAGSPRSANSHRSNASSSKSAGVGAGSVPVRPGTDSGINTSTAIGASSNKLTSSKPLKRPSTVPAKSKPKTPRSQQRTLTSTMQGVSSKSKNAKTPRSTRTLSVVLPPRNMSASSTTFLNEGEESLLPPIKIHKLHFQDSYKTHKAHWIKNALENLGTAWIRDGKATYDQLMSEEFEEKMGVFYDLAMSKKHEAIDRLVGEFEEEIGKKSKKHNKSRHHKDVQPNFPFAKHLSNNVKASMSDALLRIMTRDDGKGDASSGVKKEDESTSSNSFERELKKRKSLVQCYVVDGGKLVIGTKKGLLGVGGSFVNQFGDSRDSRVRANPRLLLESNLGFYRRTANMMGFLQHEVKIRYCKTSRQLVVSGARPQRGEENARQVREVLEIPKNVSVTNLVVLRTTKGSLIFEEIQHQEPPATEEK